MGFTPIMAPMGAKIGTNMMINAPPSMTKPRMKNKMEIIAIFLALLELIRIKEVVVRQRQLFGAIEIIRNPNNIRPKLKAQDGKN